MHAVLAGAAAGASSLPPPPLLHPPNVIRAITNSKARKFIKPLIIYLLTDLKSKKSVCYLLLITENSTSCLLKKQVFNSC